MEKTPGRILKAEQVKFQGAYHLDIAHSSQSPEPGTTGMPRARIIENKTDHAVLEITCTCGTKTHIRCDYGDIKTT